jgi:hypothetical protein
MDNLDFENFENMGTKVSNLKPNDYQMKYETLKKEMNVDFVDDLEKEINMGNEILSEDIKLTEEKIEELHNNKYFDLILFTLLFLLLNIPSFINILYSIKLLNNNKLINLFIRTLIFCLILYFYKYK